MDDAGQTAAKRALLTVFFNAHFPEMLRVARLFHDHSTIQPLILFSGEYDYRREFEQCARLGIAARYFETSTNQFRDHPRHEALNEGSRKRGIASRAFKLSSSLVRKMMALPDALAGTRRTRKAATQIIQTLAPDLVVFPAINLAFLPFYSLALNDLCQRQGIPTILVPYAWSPKAEVLASRRNFRSYRADTLTGRCIANRFPKWTYQQTLMTKPSTILAYETVGPEVNYPWTPDCEADVIAVESEMMLSHYLRDGYPAEKCVVTGSLSHDHLWNADKAKPRTLSHLTDRFGIDVNRPVILNAIPADQTGNHIPGFEFSSYRELMTFWLSELSRQTGYTIIHSIHPRMRSVREWLNASDIVYDGDICDVLPLAKFFVCTFSGVLRSAIALGIPVVNYDAFHYKMDFLYPGIGTCHAHTKAEFSAMISRMASDESFYAQTKRAQQEMAAGWGRLDGAAGARILALVQSRIDFNSQTNRRQTGGLPT